ncbi:MAG: glycosyl hydrolase [Treponema sp.]|nr:glycosyl hydrolase [Treponema sp.]
MKKLFTVGKKAAGIPVLAALCIILTTACPEEVKKADKEFSFAPVLFLTAQKQTIICNWIDSTPEADWYDIYYAEGILSNVNWIKEETKIQNTTSGFAIQGLEDGKYYSVVITANKAGYQNINSEIKTVQLQEDVNPFEPPDTPDPIDPIAPALTVSFGNAMLTLSWTDSKPAASSFDVFYIAGNTNDITEIITGIKIENASSPCTLASLTNGTTYSLAVRANTEEGILDSNVRQGTPSDSLYNFSVIPVLTVSPANNGLSISWSNSNPSADTFDIYYIAGNISNTETIKAGTLITNAVSPQTISGLNNGTTYSVVITANRSGFISANSLPKQGIPSLPGFTEVSVLTITSDNASLAVAWAESNPAADSYDIYCYQGITNDITVITTGTKISSAVSPHTISGLTNGVMYSLVIIVNKTGYISSTSTVKYGTPNVPSVSQRRSSKRGVSYSFDGSKAYEGQNTASQDMALLSPGVSWFYSWGNSMSSNLANYMVRDNVVFAPMIWNGVNNSSNQTTITNRIKDLKQKNPQIEYLLAYNEPNFNGQANLTPAQAAADWPRLKQIAADCGLKIISPALNYTPDSNHLQPLDWFKAFIAQPNVKLSDMYGIALHCYMSYPSAIKGFTADDFRSYGLPIWVTEFCAWDGSAQNLEWQEKYLSEICTYFEQDPMIAGYAWFIPRNQGINGGTNFGLDKAWPYHSLLYGNAANAQLTDLGKIYVNMSTCDKSVWVPAGTVIPAAHFTANHLEQYAGNRGWPSGNFSGNDSGTGSSVHFRPTTDTGQNAQILDIYNFTANKWVEYQIDVPLAKTYSLTLRYKTVEPANLNISIDGGAAISAALNNTAWATANVNLGVLSAGRHIIRLLVTSGRCELNWLQAD